MENIINLDGVSCSVFGKLILDDISFSVKKGEIISIIGSNGCGKSTLINVLSTVLGYTGYIDIDGYYLTKENLDIIREKVGVVFDDLNNLSVTGSVSDEIAVGLNNLGIEEFSISKRVVDIAKEFRIYNILNNSVSNISNSDKVKVFLASALISNPDVIFIDDCFHQLSVRDKELVFNILKKYNKINKLTIIMATHNMDDTLFGTRIIVLDKGKLLLDGTPRKVFRNKEKLDSCGIKLPFLIELSLKLMDKGIVDHIYSDMGKLVDDIWK